MIPTWCKYLRLAFSETFAVLVFLVIVLLLLLTQGCADHRYKPRLQVMQDGPLGQLRVTFVARETPDSHTVRASLGAVRRHQEAFAADFPASDPSAIRPFAFFNLSVTMAEDFHGPHGERLWGWTYRDRIICTAGWGRRRNDVPALYHELCHLNQVSAYGVDPRHRDTRWPIWIARSLSL